MAPGEWLSVDIDQPKGVTRCLSGKEIIEVRFSVLGWRKAFPELADLSDEVSAILDDCAYPVRFPKGTRVVGPGQPAQHLILLVSGTIRILRRLSAGGEVTLGFVRARQRSALTTACQLTFGNRAEEALAETDVELVLVARDAFDALIQRSRAFRAFVFEGCARRITELSDVIEDTAARRIDVQLARKLAEFSEPTKLADAHQQLSVELGTQPEVVTQQLNEFERRGWIALGRGLIEFADSAAILRLARESDMQGKNMTATRRS